MSSSIFQIVFLLFLGAGVSFCMNFTCQLRIDDDSNPLAKSCFVEDKYITTDGSTEIKFDIGSEKPENIVRFGLGTYEDFGLYYLPTEIFTTFPNLKEVFLETFIKAISRENLKNGKKLENIILEDNQIVQIDENAFEGLTEVKRLILRSNHLTIIQRNTFSGLNNLIKLNLGNNEIHTIEEGAFNLPKLTYLYLGTNKLKTLSDNIFSQIPLIQNINIGNNELEHIGTAFNSLNDVNLIELYGNKIEDADILEFAKLPKLKTLTLTCKNISFPSNEILETTVPNISLDYLYIGNLSDYHDLAKLKIFKNLKKLNLVGQDYSDQMTVEEFISEELPNVESIVFRNIFNGT